jgi:hypothetical protein
MSIKGEIILDPEASGSNSNHPLELVFPEV